MSDHEPLATGRVKNAKCRPPYRGSGRWCAVLSAILSDDTNRGIFEYSAVNFKTGNFTILGVAAREGCKRTGRPVLFNRCPYCGERILFAKRKTS